MIIKTPIFRNHSPTPAPRISVSIFLLYPQPYRLSVPFTGMLKWKTSLRRFYCMHATSIISYPLSFEAFLRILVN